MEFKIKKCSQCGSFNENDVIYCTECKNKLGSPLTKEEEIQAMQE